MSGSIVSSAALPYVETMPAGRAVPAGAAALCVAAIAVAGLGCGFLGGDSASAAAVKVIAATLAVGIVPGALFTLLLAPRPQLTALEVVGFGIAVSFGVLQLLTIAAVSAHLSPIVILGFLVLASAVMAGFIAARSRVEVVLSTDEAIVAVLLCILGVFLYLQGSPVDAYEDQVHVAIARRLGELPSPRLDNLYFAPDIVYTYPFPGTHYFVGLVSRLGDIDTLFLYHKLRFFWGPAALLMLYLAARAVFGTGAVACAVTVTAAILVGSGVFAMVPGFTWGWGQLAPYSHASDVAMTVLLPALLVMAFGYLMSSAARERSFFLLGAAMLTLMLAIVHIREIVQVAAYLGCFLVVALAFRGFRSYLRPALTLLGLVIAIAALYTVWQSNNVSLVTAIVDEERAKLVSTVSRSSLRALVFEPASAVLSDFMPASDAAFAGLTPFFLFAGPAVILLFRRRPLIWLVSSSTLAYLAVMSVPLLAIPYIHVTYFEILYTPIRNVIFFVYLSAGALIYVIVVALTRVDRTRLSPLVAGALAGVLALLITLCTNRSQLGFFAPLIAAYGLTFLLLRDQPWTRRVGARSIAVAAVVLLPLVALWPDQQPAPRTARVNVRWTPEVSEQQRAELERRFRLADAERTSATSADVNVWNYELSDLSQQNVQALVTDARVMDTHHIDRPTFTVPEQPPRADYPILGVEYVSWLQYPGLVFTIIAAVAAWILALVVPVLLGSARGKAAVDRIEPLLREPFHRRAAPFAMCVVPFALWSAQPTLSPLPLAPMRPMGHVATPADMMSQLPCITRQPMAAPLTDTLYPVDPPMLPEATTCPPDEALVSWVEQHVAVDAVFALNLWNAYVPSLFMPQQVVAFPPLERSFLKEKELFDEYYGFFDERMRKYRVQPFFNTVETREERAAFIESLGVTHVLVDPEYFDEMRAVLDPLSEQYRPAYSGNQWAVYEVTRNGD